MLHSCPSCCCSRRRLAPPSLLRPPRPLARQAAGATIWHINADEPSVLDYNTEFKTQDLYAPTAYRSSDHDPVVVGLRLKATLRYLPLVVR